MDQTDFELLQSFVSEGDEAAFSAIVGRHGAMVRGVCLRVLGDPSGADDAHQATFVMLASRASQLSQRPWRSATLAGWLYRVAVNKALESRRRARSRRRCEQVFAARRLESCLDQAHQIEALAALDQELAALPGRFRAPLVLCHLEGKTQEEAALELGLSYATIRRRLAQGRMLLQCRLVRRGLVWSAAFLAVFHGKAAVAALWPSGLQGAAGNGLASGSKAKLAASVPSAAGRIWAGAKLKMAAVACAAAGLYTGAILTWQRPERGGPNEMIPANNASVVLAAAASTNPAKTGDSLKLQERLQPALPALSWVEGAARPQDVGHAQAALGSPSDLESGAPRQGVSSPAESGRRAPNFPRPPVDAPARLPVRKIDDAGRGTETLYGFPLHPSPSGALKASRAGASD